MIEALKQIIKDIFQSFKNLLETVFLTILEWILNAVAWLIESIPAPEFLTAYSLQNSIPEMIVWFLQQSGFGNCLAIISAAFIFRIIRRFATLGIW